MTDREARPGLVRAVETEGAARERTTSSQLSYMLTRIGRQSASST